MLAELKKLIEANPLFRDKLQFPSLKNSRLRTLINQRLLKKSDLFYVYIIYSVLTVKSYGVCILLLFVGLQFKLAASAL